MSGTAICTVIKQNTNWAKGQRPCACQTRTKNMQSRRSYWAMTILEKDNPYAGQEPELPKWALESGCGEHIDRNLMTTGWEKQHYTSTQATGEHSATSMAPHTGRSLTPNCGPSDSPSGSRYTKWIHCRHMGKWLQLASLTCYQPFNKQRTWHMCQGSIQPGGETSAQGLLTKPAKSQKCDCVRVLLLSLYWVLCMALDLILKILIKLFHSISV